MTSRRGWLPRLEGQDNDAVSSVRSDTRRPSILSSCASSTRACPPHQRSYLSEDVPPARPLSSRCSSGPSSLSTALASRQGRLPASLQRRELAAHRSVADLVALILSG